MSDDLSEWPYSEYGSAPSAKMRISDLLKDAGWDDDVRRVYGTTDDDENEFDELEFGSDLSFRDRCECKIVQLFSAADDLKEFLEQDPSKFPKTISQLDSFAAFGGWAHGTWSMYINGPSSIPHSKETGGSLHLFGCSAKGHSCRVLMSSDGVLTIRAEKPELFNIEVGHLPNTDTAGDSHDDDEGEDEDMTEEREAQEEALYDRRTYSEFEEVVDEEDEADEVELISVWRDFMAPEAEISVFVKMGLDPEEVMQLARLIPRSQVLDWVELFGSDSMMGLEYLKIGIGDVTTKEELEDIDFDELRASIADAIRSAIYDQLARTKDRQRVIDDESEDVDDGYDDEEIEDED
jgi:hypothetical protein